MLLRVRVVEPVLGLLEPRDLTLIAVTLVGYESGPLIIFDRGTASPTAFGFKLLLAGPCFLYNVRTTTSTYRS